jgi:hypothetical protein
MTSGIRLTCGCTTRKDAVNYWLAMALGLVLDLAFAIWVADMGHAD